MNQIVFIQELKREEITSLYKLMNQIVLSKSGREKRLPLSVSRESDSIIQDLKREEITSLYKLMNQILSSKSWREKILPLSIS